MHDANAWKLNLLPSRYNAHKSLVLCSRYYIAGNERFVLLDQILNRYSRVWEYLPKGAIELLHTFQPRFNSLIAMQDDIIRIETEVLTSSLRVTKTLDCLLEILPV